MIKVGDSVLLEFKVTSMSDYGSGTNYGGELMSGVDKEYNERSRVSFQADDVVTFGIATSKPLWTEVEPKSSRRGWWPF